MTNDGLHPEDGMLDDQEALNESTLSITELLNDIYPYTEDFTEELPAEELYESGDALEPSKDPTEIDYDTYLDSGEYRSFDGSHEYRSFDAALPDASPDEWYHYSAEDQELDEPEPPKQPEKKQKGNKKRNRHPILSAISHGLLVFFAVFSIAYLVAVYSDIPTVRQLRNMYIQTAMSTLNHKWMATAIIPGDIIDEVMRARYESDAAAVGIESNWGTVTVQELPNFESATVQNGSPDETAEAAPATAAHEENMSSEEATFYALFWEIDRTSMQAYLDQHPEALSNGWAGININESGLDQEGTSIQTIYGDQVLALNAVDGVMLARVYLSSNASRGVLAICKDTSRLTLKPAETFGIIGQTAGRIADANNGILAINGSAFLDPNGAGDGSAISGLALCDGVEYGTRLGGTAKRLEVRDDNKMYIVDSDSAVGTGTRDACEFQPAVLVDGELIDSDWSGPHPRALLGQTSRLETIAVIVEGRLSDSLGCGVEDVGLKMQQYGCVQAINLDGGTSAIMYYDGEYITRCSNQDLPGGRTLPTAWVYSYAN